MESNNKAFDRIPTEYRVGGQKIKVSIVDGLEDDKLGQCCVAEGEVKIAKNFGRKEQSASSMLNTFFHELTHSILDTMGENELSCNERFVSCFSSFLLESILTMNINENK